MNSLLNQVTPSTRAIIWLTQADIAPSHSWYKSMDYLLDGLLTANRDSLAQGKSHLLVGKNFGHPFFLLVVRELEKKELDGFVTVVYPELKEGQKILVMDEDQNFESLKKQAPEKIRHFFQKLQ